VAVLCRNLPGLHVVVEPCSFVSGVSQHHRKGWTLWPGRAITVSTRGGTFVGAAHVPHRFEVRLPLPFPNVLTAKVASSILGEDSLVEERSLVSPGAALSS